MRRCPGLLALLGSLCLAPGASAEAPAPGVVPDFATAVAVDRSGDAIVTGLHMRRPGAEPGCDFFAAKLRHDTGAVAWRTQFPDCKVDEALGPANGEQVFIDAGGDIVVAKRATRSFAVLKLSGATGAILWSQHVGDYPKHAPYVHTSALDAAGNIIAAGGFGRYADGQRTTLEVAKLDGADGREHWRRALRGTFMETEDHGAFNQVRAVATDARGDALVSGMLVNGRRHSAPHRRWVILKLDGGDGTTRWMRHVGETSSLLQTSGDDRVYPSLAIDSAGNVLSVAATTRRRAPRAEFLTVVKIDGGSGHQRWRHTMTLRAEAWHGEMLALTGDGGVAVASAVRLRRGSRSMVVGVLDGASGRERWRRVIDGSADETSAVPFGRYDAPAALTVDAAGDVLLAGLLWNAESRSDFTVIALDATNGSERWRRVIDGGAYGDDGARGLAPASGDVFVVGEAERPATGADAFVVSLAASSGEERWRLLCDGAESCAPEGEGASVVPSRAPIVAVSPPCSRR